MELIDWITIAVFFAIGFWFGWKIQEYLMLGMTKLLLKDLGITNEQLIKVAKDSAKLLGQEYEDRIREIEAKSKDIDGLEQIEIKVEKHGEMLYAFRNDNDQFLGQGVDKESLVEAMAHRVSNVRCTVVEGNEYMKSEA